MKRSIALSVVFLLAACSVFSQPGPGIIQGNLLDAESGKPIAAATISLLRLTDSLAQSSLNPSSQSAISDKQGGFGFTRLAPGYYRLRISSSGYAPLTIDSIHLRTERFDFNLNDIKLNKSHTSLERVIVYAEKPLIESKEGNITFNAGESALSSGSSAGELLKQVPLVSTDPNGKVLVKGKEPRILIDDKPVDLNAQQLADLLESLPGSMIEKIEVMTNPPPQYANERGGVINIVTKKGRPGYNGRINTSYGSRGELGASGNFSYRHKKWAVQFNSGISFNRLPGESGSTRQNFYADSSNFFKTAGSSLNKSIRPSVRLNIDYEKDKRNAFNFSVQANRNQFDNESQTNYRNISFLGRPYRVSEREVNTNGYNLSPSVNFSWVKKGRLPGVVLRLQTGASLGDNENDRYFFQQFLSPDELPTGVDSTQRQITQSLSRALNLRINYDRPLVKQKTFLSAGAGWNQNSNHVELNTDFLKKPEMQFLRSGLLSNDFRFRQGIGSVRASVKHLVKKDMAFTAGLSGEWTEIGFRFLNTGTRAGNDYFNLLPFATLNWNRDKLWQYTLAYRRSIQRPGIGELNPAIDYSDPYNLRFGNPGLLPSPAHNFDAVMGKNKGKWFINFSLGYNVLQDIYSIVRSLLPDGRTQVTWENISGRKEYESGAWGGYSVNTKIRLNFSLTYVYNRYSAFDRTVNRYRNGASLLSSLSGNFNPTPLQTFTGAFTFNRFANPQGRVRSSLSMNMGWQLKLMEKKMLLAINIIDPFRQQYNRSATFGPNFSVETYSVSQTRNIKLTLSWLFNSADRLRKKIVQKAR